MNCKPFADTINVKIIFVAIDSTLIEQVRGFHSFDLSKYQQIIKRIGLIVGIIILGFIIEGIHLILESGKHSSRDEIFWLFGVPLDSSLPLNALLTEAIHSIRSFFWSLLKFLYSHFLWYISLTTL